LDTKKRDRAIIEFTCIPDVRIEDAQKMYDIGFNHVREFLLFILDREAKERGLVDILNYKILSQYITVDEEDIPHKKFKCPMCMADVFADEEECSDCGALLMEEILDIEMEDVYVDIRAMMETVISQPEGAKRFLSDLYEGEDRETIEEMVVSGESIEGDTGIEKGFVVTSFLPGSAGGNYILVLMPLGDYVEERQKVQADLLDLGANNESDFPIDGGNIVNKQQEAVKDVVTKYLSDDLDPKQTNNIFLLNLKIANFGESKATMIVEDNRPFLSSLDEIDLEDVKKETIERMVYDAKLINDMRRIGDKFILDGVSFNNDPISYLLIKESTPILRANPDMSFHLVDAVLNLDSVKRDVHNELINMLMKWNK
jgi:ribosomal protein S27AE